MKDIVLFPVIIFCFSSELLIAICTELPVEKVNGRTFIYVANDIIKNLPQMYIISLPPFYNPLILLKSIQIGMTLRVFFFIIIDSRRYLLTKFYQLKTLIRLAIVLNND